jgi:hypothetical protein
MPPERRSSPLSLRQRSAEMWTYVQSTGDLFDPNGQRMWTGYSGFAPDGKNNPAAQDEANIGPIPRGTYTIGAPECVETDGPHGPFVLPLTPDPSNEMFGRSGFLCHGDSIEHAGSASHGCIIMPLAIRTQIASSNDDQLVVVASRNE